MQKNLQNAKLRDQRRLRGWTQADLATTLGVTNLTVGRWERGEAIPFPYYQQKLMDLFDATPEELGFNTTREKADLVATPDLDPQQALATPGLDPQQVQKDSSNASLNEAIINPAPLQSTSHEITPPPIIIASKPEIFSKCTLPVSFRWLSVVLVVVVIASTLIILLSSKQITAVVQRATNPDSSMGAAKASSSTQSKQAVTVLYRADWSQNTDHWSLSSDVHWVGGMLVTDPTIANTIIFAPYSPTPALSSYAVEIQMQRRGYSGIGGRAYGIAVRTTSSDGYICGVGAHFYPEHFFMAQLNPADSAPRYRLSDMYDANSSLDTLWHTYRVEVKQNKMAFFLDHLLIQTLDIAPFLHGGRIGIYVDNAAIAIKDFSVFTLV